MPEQYDRRACAYQNTKVLQTGCRRMIRAFAHTRLLEREQNDTILLDAPIPGKYASLSTLPNQYAGGIQGTLAIK